MSDRLAGLMLLCTVMLILMKRQVIIDFLHLVTYFICFFVGAIFVFDFIMIVWLLSYHEHCLDVLLGYFFV